MKKVVKNAIIILIGVIINIVGRYLSHTFQLPVWLDMIGTCIATYYSGLFGGIVVGLCNNLFAAIFNLSSLYYFVVSIASAYMLYVLMKREYLNNALRAAICSFWLGLLCMVISTPLNLILKGGYSGNIWGDALFDMLRWYDVSLLLSAIAGEAIVEIFDKQICVMVAYLVIKICDRYMEKVEHNRIMKSTMITFLAIAMFLTPMDVEAAKTDVFADNFVEEIYDNTTGMVSSDANVICETDDGYIWIGSYAGLSRYNGTDFEFITEGGLVNVVSMMTDSKGRLWIGTNDAGIARYEDGKYTYFTRKNGLPTDSIRCFAEDNDGNIYVGTSESICIFSSDDSIEVMDVDISFAKEMEMYGDILVVNDNAGDIYAIDGNKLLVTRDSAEEEYLHDCIAMTKQGLIAGNDTGKILKLRITEKEILVAGEIDVPVNKIVALYEDSQERIWVASDSGLGYVDTKGIYHETNHGGFNVSTSCFYEDYQGNIWVASTHHGVMKLSESHFVNIFDRAQIEKEVVNAIVHYNGYYYCGTDGGLIAIDDTSIEGVQNDIVATVADSRVRSLFVDSRNRLWICSYNGLFCYDGNQVIHTFTTEEDGATSDRFRCIAEMSDGTIVAGTADGINFIKNDKLVETASAEDGLANTQILSVSESVDGYVWAGSDGSGIYVFEEGKLIANYTVENGLSSNVVLRLVPYGDGFIIVTSNALCYADATGDITKLDKFPYFNNYDVMIRDRKAYVTCSAGMYAIDVDELCANDTEGIKLYNVNDGLLSGLTANSWNCFSDNGELFLCSNSGVIVFDETQKRQYTDLKFGLVGLESDGVMQPMEADEVYTIPSDTEKITLYADVRNYAFDDVNVRFYVEELDEKPAVYHWDHIEPVHIDKPTEQMYHAHLEILDASDGEVLQKKTYTINREMHMWEKPWYITYLVFVCLEILIFTLVSIVGMIHFMLGKRELENVQVMLAEKVGQQTQKLRLSQKRTEELYVQTITALSDVVDAKDRYTSGHSKRVAKYAYMIACRMGKSEEECNEIHRAGLLHDVGKIRIPEEIINKPGKLTEAEYSTIKIHPITGYHILSGISGSEKIALGAKYHHERYDGKGYPNGLVGENIPEVARILGVADAYDAMTSHRSYRKALPQYIVREEIVKCRGTQFDPEIADILLQMIDEDENYELRQKQVEHKRVLVVDDEAVNSKIVKNIMKDEDMYEVISAYSGAEALEILQQTPVNLILLDLNMPGMDGTETLKRIREKYDVPVVLITGDKTLNISEDLSALGCREYITKPFQPLLLKEIIYNIA